MQLVIFVEANCNLLFRRKMKWSLTSSVHLWVLQVPGFNANTSFFPTLLETIWRKTIHILPYKPWLHLPKWQLISSCVLIQFPDDLKWQFSTLRCWLLYESVLYRNSICADILFVQTFYLYRHYICTDILFVQTLHLIFSPAPLEPCKFRKVLTSKF